MAMMKRNRGNAGYFSTIEKIAERMRDIMADDPSRIITLDGLMVHDAPGRGGVVERLHLHSIFFDENGCPCGDIINRRHDGEGLILGRKLANLGDDDLERILAYLKNFAVMEPAVDMKNRVEFSFNLAGTVARAITRYRSVQRHA